MSANYRRVIEMLQREPLADPTAALPAPRPETQPAPPAVPGGSHADRASIAARWDLPGMPASSRPPLLDEGQDGGVYTRNVENFIGTVKVPVGLAGPLRVNGTNARGDFYVPLATTEATLVASYSRGAQIITRAGGCTAVLLSEGVSRAPAFAFDTLPQAALFAAWASSSIDVFRQCAAATTSYGRLADLHVAVEGNHVYLEFSFTTGDASGQNMVTIATDAICRHIIQH